MFEIKNVSKQYNGEGVLNNVSLNIGKGLHFIVGASGSGKTTLLKIMSGMEQEFDGEVLYCGKSIKALSAKDRSYFYNNVFGFVWQDFHLVEENTVLENVMLPQMLKKNQSRKDAVKTLKDLKIFDLAPKKVKYLSGGQKQRVAIARELMKNPQVILADEPTSSLDKKAAKTTMDILRILSKNRAVIVVTHNASFIAQTDQVYALDKGELTAKPESSVYKTPALQMHSTHRLSLKNAFTLAKVNAKNKAGRLLIASITLVLASVLLLTTVSGAISGNSQGEFDKLFATYGDSLTDIGLYKGFTDAAGADGEENKKPNGEVNQDINGLYDVYAKDERIAFIAYLQAFDDIKIKADGREYKIESSGNMPSINKLVAGKMPMGEGHEVVVPESFAKKAGVSVEQLIGKEIDFTGSIVDWSSGSPVWKNAGAKAKIVGVMNTTVKYDMQEQVGEYTIDDAFLFSKAALESMTRQAGTNMDTMSFLIRAKTPAAMIAIKDELNEKGIVPLGRFELVEDMVRLGSQTAEQSSSAGILIGLLSLAMVIAVFLLTGFMRKKEMAIYKACGFTASHLFLMSFAETITSAIAAVVLLLLSSPVLNLATKGLFGVELLQAKMLFTSVALMMLAAALAYLAAAIPSATVKIDTALQSGDRS